ncbi:hypothetical protein [uncultured Lacinutrix sp.]|uniref:hypothetical protein n=1 Tax=uncultured Lacinutrix sp. TaxID=574032 RepID=UPI0026332F2B|nr:hypothetical protein [uncultured Lacinutrix sp.]
MQQHYKTYALFKKTVPESKKYTVKPESDVFLTKQEAIEACNRRYEQGLNKWHSLKIMMLWKSKKIT